MARKPARVLSRNASQSRPPKPDCISAARVNELLALARAGDVAAAQELATLEIGVEGGKPPAIETTVRDARGERRLVIPSNEVGFLSGDMDLAPIVLDVESRHDIRLRDGDNPLWLVRLERQFVSDPKSNVTFAEFVSRRFPERISRQPSATPEGPTPAKSSRQKATVNARMLDAMLKNELVRGWTATQWAEHLKCGRATVVETKCWKELEVARNLMRAERISDRRRQMNGGK